MAGPGTRLYNIWRGIKARCQSPTSRAYKWYGAQGVTVCPEWQTFIGFLDWALLSGYGSERVIDRIDADGPYAPSNCRWVLPTVNAQRATALDRRGGYLPALRGRIDDDRIVHFRDTSTKAKLYDGRGLYLHRTRAGYSWRYRFRFDGVEQLLTLGRYPDMTLIEARELHLVARLRVAAGRNPARIKAETIERARRQRVSRGYNT